MSKTSPECLGDFFASIICSKHNQHAIVRIVGLAGTGKSWAGLDLSLEIAQCVAERIGGKQTDFFSVVNDLGVMSKSEIKRVMDNPGKHHILMLDDVGLAWNARKFNDKFNIDMNDIIQTFRPNHNVVIMTMQSGFLVDKVPRSIAHYEIEMESSNFDEGFSIAKVQEVVLKHKTGDLHYPYIYIDGCKYKRHVFEKPPKEFTDAYEAERAKQLAKIKSEKELAEQIPEENQNKNTKSTQQEEITEIGRDFDAGVFGDLTLKEVCIARKINYNTARTWLSKSKK